MKKGWMKAIACWMLLALVVMGCQKVEAEIGGSPEGHVGFAAVGPGVTGGEGGETVTVSTVQELLQYIDGEEPYIIQITGTIDLYKMHPVGSNKTLIGLGDDTVLRYGGLELKKSNNVIIRNITFKDADDDSINIELGQNIWIDHNEFTNGFDGLLDIKYGSKYITVSWNKFYNHDKTSLVGHSDKQIGDRDNLQVTYHHNWFDNVRQRHPRVRFGEVHVYNNYYSNIGLYAIGIGAEAKVYSENNYFDGVEQPFRYYDNEEQPGYVVDKGSYYHESGEPELRPSGIKWDPKKHYPYELDPAEDVKQRVMENAGVGKIN